MPKSSRPISERIRCSLAESLLGFILHRLEEFPGASFLGTELQERNAEEFKALRETRLLRFLQQRPERLLAPCPSGPSCEAPGREVVPSQGKWWGMCNCPAEEPPIEVTLEDLHRYEFCVKEFAEVIRGHNGLSGPQACLCDRTYLIGDAKLANEKTAVVFALLDQQPRSVAIVEALYSRLPSHFSRIVVLTPSYTPGPTDAVRLEARGIFVVAGVSSDNFVLVADGNINSPSIVDGHKVIGDDRLRPSPSKHTTGKCWTRKNGVVCISTKTDGVYDGQVEFAPTPAGELTYQMRFVQLMCFKFPEAATLAEVIEQVYPDEFAKVRGDADALRKLLRKLRSLVSDVRNKKFGKANLNPDILPPLSVEASLQAGIRLRLAHLHQLDDHDLDESDEATD